MVTLSSCLIWQIISFILSPNEYGCVYAWTMLGNIATLLLAILAKKIIFSYEAHFYLGGYVNKQNCRIWGIENPHAYIEKPTHPKRVTVWCGFWSRGLIGSFFSENEQRTEFLFTKIEEEDIGNICCFWRSHYQPQAEVVWPPRSCDLTSLDYYLWDAVKDKCYASKPETIDALEDNIRKLIGEIQLHTIDNVLKNSTDRVGYCMASRGSHLNGIIFHS